MNDGEIQRKRGKIDSDYGGFRQELRSGDASCSLHERQSSLFIEYGIRLCSWRLNWQSAATIIFNMGELIEIVRIIGRMMLALR